MPCVSIETLSFNILSSLRNQLDNSVGGRPPPFTWPEAYLFLTQRRKCGNCWRLVEGTLNRTVWTLFESPHGHSSSLWSSHCIPILLTWKLQAKKEGAHFRSETWGKVDQQPNPSQHNDGTCYRWCFGYSLRVSPRGSCVKCSPCCEVLSEWKPKSIVCLREELCKGEHWGWTRHQEEIPVIDSRPFYKRESKRLVTCSLPFAVIPCDKKVTYKCSLLMQDQHYEPKPTSFL